MAALARRHGSSEVTAPVIDLNGLFAEGVIEPIARKFRLGEEPGEVEEWSGFNGDERLAWLIEMRARRMRWRYGVEPGLERVLEIVRRT